MPSTLHPNAQTLYHSPFTLHPSPSTLDPQPKSQTFNPEPYTPYAPHPRHSAPRAPNQIPRAPHSEPRASSPRILQEKLTNGLQPAVLVVSDDSGKHANHKGLHDGHAGVRSNESHFRVVVVADAFEGMNPVKRHRMVNAILQQEFDDGLHALQVRRARPVLVSTCGAQARCVTTHTPPTVVIHRRRASATRGAPAPAWSHHTRVLPPPEARSLLHSRPSSAALHQNAS